MKDELKITLSVIVPVYNTEYYLRRCLSSILEQDLNNLEVIVVDDGSTDKSGNICDEYAAKDIRVKVIHQNNKGISEARNNGFAIAKGEYITYVDSDDYLPDDMGLYRRAIDNMENKNLDILVGLWQYQDESGNFLIDIKKIPAFFNSEMSTEKFAEGFYYGNYANGLVVAVWNKIYRKEFIKDLKYYGRIYEDDRWMTQVLRKYGKVYCAKEFCYIYVQNKNSLTNSRFDQNHLEMLNTLSQRATLFENNRFIRINSLKTYLNLYIEYWYKAKDAKVDFIEDKLTYNAYFDELKEKKECTKKEQIRYALFKHSKTGYEFLVKKIMRKGL